MTVCRVVRCVVAHAMAKHKVTLDDFVERGRSAIKRVLCFVDPNLARWDVAWIDSFIASVDEVDVFITNEFAVDEVDREPGHAA